MRVAAGVVITLAVMTGFFFLAVFACCGFLGSIATPTSPRVVSTDTPTEEANVEMDSWEAKPPAAELTSSPPVKPKATSPAHSEPDAELRGVMNWIRAGRPKITRLKIGVMGAVDGLSIVQIIDDQTALCMVDDSLQTVMVQGFNMRNQADGQKIGLPLVHVTHTTQYVSVLGANKTVFVLQGVNRIEEAEEEIANENAEEYVRHLHEEAARKAESERMAAEAKQIAEQMEAEEREAQFRTWRSASGKFTIDARLVRYSNGTVVLEKRSGEEIDVDEKQLSDDDRTFIQDEMKRRLRGR